MTYTSKTYIFLHLYIYFTLTISSDEVVLTKRRVSDPDTFSTSSALADVSAVVAVVAVAALVTLFSTTLRRSLGAAVLVEGLLVSG